MQAQSDDSLVPILLAECLQEEKRFKESAELLQKLTTTDKSTKADFNALGWNAVLGHTVTQENIDPVQRAASANNQDAGLLHTLAMMYAEIGKTREARALAIEAMNAWGLAEPNSDIWLIYGRVAESYGLREAARSAYRKVTLPPSQMPLIGSTSYAIAQEHLKILAE